MPAVCDQYGFCLCCATGHQKQSSQSCLCIFQGHWHLISLQMLQLNRKVRTSNTSWTKLVLSSNYSKRIPPGSIMLSFTLDWSRKPLKRTWNIGLSSLALGLLHWMQGLNQKLVASQLFQLQGRNPHFYTLGEASDISNLAQFGWYDFVYYQDIKEAYPYLHENLGQCIRA